MINAAALTMDDCSIYNNRAGTSGGGLLIGGTTPPTVLLTNATRISGNSAPSGNTYSFESGALLYQLPAPPGTWIAGVECIILRDPCPAGPPGAACRQPARLRACSLNANDTDCPAVSGWQACNWNSSPDLLGQTLQGLPFGDLDDDYPFACAAGVRGAVDLSEQAGPQCAGPCAAGTYRQDTSEVECRPCPAAAFCPPGAATPLLCPGGTYANATGAASAAECNSTAPGFFAPLGSVTPTPCAAGTVAPRGGLERCEPCASGTFQDGVGNVTCRPCPTGAFCPLGAATPIPCPDGQYGNGTGATAAAECDACPPGSWCNSGQAFPCGVGLIAVGDAASRTNLGACAPCPDDATTRGPGTASMADCVCFTTFLTNPHAAADGNRRCIDCPLHLDCPDVNTTLPDLVVDAGHWRPGFHTTIARPCPHRDVCASGTTEVAVYDRSDDVTCTAGRGVAGAYCLLCMEPETHYFDVAQQRCLPCAATTGGAVALLVVAALAIAAAWFTRRWLAARLGGTWRRWDAYATKLSFRAKLRTIISFLQIVTQLERVYVLQYPQSFRSFVGVLSVVNVELYQWVPGLRLSCLVTRSLSAQLLLVCLVPLGVTLCGPLVAALRGKPLASSLPFVLGCTFLVLPSISSFAFRTFAPCECFPLVDGGEQCFLREDYEIVCTGTFLGRAAPPADVLAAAWLTVVVWAVGAPLLYAALLYMSRRRQSELRPKLGMLLGDYHPASAAWELVVVVEKLTLIGFLALAEPGTWMQLFIGTAAALSAFVLQARVAPYRTPSDNLFAFLASLALLAVFLGSLGLQTDALGVSVDSTLLVVILFGFTLLVLLAAIVFFAAELRGVREILLVRATRQPPTLALAEGKTWHAFISHNWDNQDAAATIKRQLQLLLPGVRIFLDVDDLEAVDALEGYMRQSHSILILLGSPRYFASGNCLREVASATQLGLPSIGVHDSDASKHGAPLTELRNACPDEHRGYVFGDGDAGTPPLIAWHRVRDFQLMALAQIAERVLLACPEHAGSPAKLADGLPLCVDGGLAWAPLGFGWRPLAVYQSEHDANVVAVARELRVRFGASVLERASAVGDGGGPWLLMLSADTFEGAAGERLAAEVEAALGAGVRLVTVYDPEANAFSAIIDATPRRLRERKLFDALAIEWRGGVFRPVSVALVARALGAQVERGWGAWAREQARGCAEAVERVCCGLAMRARVGERGEQLVEGNGGVRAIEMRTGH